MMATNSYFTYSKRTGSSKKVSENLNGDDSMKNTIKTNQQLNAHKLK